MKTKSHLYAKTRNSKARISIIITALLLAALLLTFASCGRILERADKILTEIARDMPTAENTYTSIADVNAAMQDVMRSGEDTFEFNIADVTEDDLAHIANHMSTFWGEPKEYMVNSVFRDLEDIVPGRAVDVKSVTNTFVLSNNYYVYEYIRNGVPIPEDRPRAVEIADALAAVKSEIFAEAGEVDEAGEADEAVEADATDEASETGEVDEAVDTDFGLTLAAHDWLVANLDYDDSIGEHSDQNGSYGALVDRRTMCQGYAEALELILRCYTDVEITQVVGDARDNAASADSADRADWVGHAWNAVRTGGQWVHIDATFDDPKGNPAGAVSHFYFAQNDAVIQADHRWENEYFPVCGGEDFLYYRYNNLFADDYEGFEEICTRILADAKQTQFEIATVGVSLDEDNIQFMFNADLDIEEVYWSEQTYGAISVQNIEPRYTDEEAETL